jgi:tripartite-type tricarboxylate transporter receptor subunit TctC
MGLFAPAGTPAQTIGTLEAECASAMKDSQLQAKLLQLGLEPAYMNAADFAGFLRTEYPTWAAAFEAGSK